MRYPLALALVLWASLAWAETALEPLNAATLEAYSAGDLPLATQRAAEAAKVAEGQTGAPAADAFYYHGFLLGEAPEAEVQLGRAIALYEAAGLQGSANHLAAYHRLTGFSPNWEARLATLLAKSAGTDWAADALGIASAAHFIRGDYEGTLAYLKDALAEDKEFLRPMAIPVLGQYVEALQTVEFLEDRVPLIQAQLAVLRAFPELDPDGAIHRETTMAAALGLITLDRYRDAEVELDTIDLATLTREEAEYLLISDALAPDYVEIASFTTPERDQLALARLSAAVQRLVLPLGDRQLGKSLRFLGLAEQKLALYDDARRTFLEALAGLEGNPEAALDTFFLLTDLYELEESAGNDAAEAGFRARSEALRERLVQEGVVFDGMDQIVRLLNEANKLNRDGAFAEALTFVTQAEPLFEATRAVRPFKWNEQYQYARYLYEKAFALFDAGQTEESAALMRQAVAVAREHIPAPRPELANVMAQAADVLQLVGDRATARALTEEAIAIYLETRDPRVPEVLEAKVLRSTLDMYDGDGAALLAGLREITEGRKAPQYSGHLGSAAWDFERLAWMLLKDGPSDPAAVDEALAALQWTQVTQSAEAIVSAEQRLGADDPALASAFERQKDLRATLAEKSRALHLAVQKGALADQGLAGLPAEIATHEAAFQAVEAELLAAGYAMAEITQPNPLTLAEIQALLAEDEVLVTFVLGGINPERTPLVERSANLAIAITRDGIQVATSGEYARKRLNARIVEFRCDVALMDPFCQSNAATEIRLAALGCAPGDPLCETRSGFLGDEPDYGTPSQDFKHELAYGLYRDLFGGLQAATDGKAHMIIVPPTDLLRLPFAALVTDPTPRPLAKTPWLVRRHALSVLPSIPALRALREGAPPQGEGLLAVGDPVVGFPAQVDCSDHLSGVVRAVPAAFQAMADGPTEGGIQLANLTTLRGLSRLPFSVCEIEAVRARFPPEAQTVLLAEAATEARIKALDQAGDLSGYDTLLFATHGLVAGEAGAASPGLLLTPPETASLEDDGLLTAAEILTLDLDARLVVLSACNTAAGDQGDADGLAGLARAFFGAGARALLVTHWSVYSVSAAEISAGVLAVRADAPEVRTAEALRQMQLALIDGTSPHPLSSHPSYWAAYAVVGAD